MGASQFCKNKGGKIIRDRQSRIVAGIQSCDSSDYCSDPELMSSKQYCRFNGLESLDFLTRGVFVKDESYFSDLSF